MTEVPPPAVSVPPSRAWESRAGFFISKAGFDPPQRLSDRVVFKLEARQPAINLVEMTEHIAPKFANLIFDSIEAPVDSFEVALDFGKLSPKKLH